MEARLMQQRMVDSGKASKKYQASQIANLAAGIDKPKKQSRSRFKTILKECCEMLDYLGVPYVQAAGEAEAMCAFLNYSGVVDACITDDGDVFLYGAKTVYRNFTMNVADPHVECYTADSVSHDLHMDRTWLVAMGVLLGCDYVPKGVSGVGKEMYMKLMAALGRIDILQRMRNWHSMAESELSSLERQIRKKALATAGFPFEKVIDEYLVCRDKLPRLPLRFTRPRLGLIQQYMYTNLEWPHEYTEEKIVPLITLFDLRSIVEKGIENCPNHMVPLRIVKKRVRQGVDCLEVEWKRPVPTADCDTSTTIEERDLFTHCFPDMVKEWCESVELRTRKPAKKKKTKTSTTKENLDSELSDCLSALTISETEHTSATSINGAHSGVECGSNNGSEDEIMVVENCDFVCENRNAGSLSNCESEDGMILVKNTEYKRGTLKHTDVSDTTHNLNDKQKCRKLIQNFDAELPSVEDVFSYEVDSDKCQDKIDGNSLRSRLLRRGIGKTKTEIESNFNNQLNDKSKSVTESNLHHKPIGKSKSETESDFTSQPMVVDLDSVENSEVENVEVGEKIRSESDWNDVKKIRWTEGNKVIGLIHDNSTTKHMYDSISTNEVNNDSRGAKSREYSKTIKSSNICSHQLLRNNYDSVECDTNTCEVKNVSKNLKPSECNKMKKASREHDQALKKCSDFENDKKNFSFTLSLSERIALAKKKSSANILKDTTKDKEENSLDKNNLSKEQSVKKENTEHSFHAIDSANEAELKIFFDSNMSISDNFTTTKNTSNDPPYTDTTNDFRENNYNRPIASSNNAITSTHNQIIPLINSNRDQISPASSDKSITSNQNQIIPLINSNHDQISHNLNSIANDSLIILGDESMNFTNIEVNTPHCNITRRSEINFDINCKPESEIVDNCSTKCDVTRKLEKSFDVNLKSDFDNNFKSEINFDTTFDFSQAVSNFDQEILPDDSFDGMASDSILEEGDSVKNESLDNYQKDNNPIGDNEIDNNQVDDEPVYNNQIDNNTYHDSFNDTNLFHELELTERFTKSVHDLKDDSSHESFHSSSFDCGLMLYDSFNLNPGPVKSDFATNGDFTISKTDDKESILTPKNQTSGLKSSQNMLKLKINEKCAENVRNTRQNCLNDKMEISIVEISDGDFSDFFSDNEHDVQNLLHKQGNIKKDFKNEYLETTRLDTNILVDTTNSKSNVCIELPDSVSHISNIKLNTKIPLRNNISLDTVHISNHKTNIDDIVQNDINDSYETCDILDISTDKHNIDDIVQNDINDSYALSDILDISTDKHNIDDIVQNDINDSYETCDILDISTDITNNDDISQTNSRYSTCNDSFDLFTSILDSPFSHRPSVSTSPKSLSQNATTDPNFPQIALNNNHVSPNQLQDQFPISISPNTSTDPNFPFCDSYISPNTLQDKFPISISPNPSTDPNFPQIALNNNHVSPNQLQDQFPISISQNSSTDPNFPLSPCRLMDKFQVTEHDLSDASICGNFDIQHSLLDFDI